VRREERKKGLNQTYFLPLYEIQKNKQTKKTNIYYNIKVKVLIYSLSYLLSYLLLLLVIYKKLILMLWSSY